METNNGGLMPDNKGMEILAKQPVNPLTTSIIKGLAEGNSVSITQSLRLLKVPGGAPDFVGLLKLPMEDRIQGLIENIGLKIIHQLLAAAITVAMESLNLRVTLNGQQIFDLVDAIIDTSAEDALALEDVLLFLQELVRGGAGDTYNKMDIAMFLNLFEHYRRKRYSTLKAYEKEQHIIYSGLGPGRTGGTTLNRDEDPKTTLGLMQTLYEYKHNLK